MTRILLFFAVILFSAKSFAAVYYVDASKANNTGAGTSWATAKKDIQNAIDLATSGDQIWIKAGTYYPTVDLFNSSSPTDTRDKTFFVKNGVSLYGGFAGTETLLSERNIPNNQTILSGDIGVLATSSDNCYHVITCVGNADASTFDGLIITDGTTATSSSTVTVSSTTVNRNRGAGIMITYASLSSVTYTIKNCVLKNHLGGNGNGAVANVFNTNLTIENSIFANNSVTQTTVGNGVALNSSGTNLTISNSVFLSNQYTTSTGGSGGAIQTSTSNNTFTNCTFSDNKVGSSGNGGAIYFASTIHTSVFKNCIFYNNLKGSSTTSYGADISFNGNSTNLTATNCMLQLSQSNDYVSVTTGLNASSSGNIFSNSNPSFTNAADVEGVDNKYFTSDDGLSLQSGSAAINAGTSTGAPANDITGASRSGNPEIGAYEFVVTSTTWNGSTWSSGNPSSTIDAIIASSVAPSSFTCKALTINSGVALTTTGITATVNGNIINNGNGIAGTGGLTIAANSTLSGTAISFNGTLTVNSGAVLTTGGLLTLTSNASNTARVAAGASAGGYISGNVTVQRYIPGGSRKNRFLGHPFSSAMNLTELTDNIDITGTITGSNANGFTATTTNNPSAFTFTEANGDAATGTTNNAGWTAFSSGNSISTVAAGQGIRVLVRGTKGQTNSLNGGSYTPAAVTLDMTGPLRQGDFTQTLSYTIAAKGWNLITNPYASNIDWSLVTRTNVDNAIYCYRPSLSGGNYGTYINGSAANGGSQYIEAYSSFFVRANAASPSLGWQEVDKVSNNPTNSVFRNNTNNIHNRLSLTLTNETTQDTDEVVVRFGDDPATDDFDSQYDAYNLAGASHDLYVIDNQQNHYSIYHGRALNSNWPSETRTVQLGINNLTAGTYTINTQILNDLTDGNKLYLKDAVANTLTEVTNGNVYTFTVSNNISSGSNRFSLVFNDKKSIIQTIKELSIKLSPNPAKETLQVTYAQTQELNSSISITNLLGKQVQSINLGKVQYGIQNINISKLAAGTYFVQWNNGVETRTLKLLVE